MDQLVYGRVTKLVPFGAFIQVGDGIEGLVHISEMAAHHVESPDQVVTPGEELWVKIIELDTARRRISLSIKQAAEGGEVSEEYREAFGSHAYDTEGNYIGGLEYGEFTPETESQAAWAEFAVESGKPTDEVDADAPLVDAAPVVDAAPEADTAPGAEAETAADAEPSRLPVVADQCVAGSDATTASGSGLPMSKWSNRAPVSVTSTARGVSWWTAANILSVLVVNVPTAVDPGSPVPTRTPWTWWIASSTTSTLTIGLSGTRISPWTPSAFSTPRRRTTSSSPSTSSSATSASQGLGARARAAP